MKLDTNTQLGRSWGGSTESGVPPGYILSPLFYRSFSFLFSLPALFDFVRCVFRIAPGLELVYEANTYFSLMFPALTHELTVWGGWGCVSALPQHSSESCLLFPVPSRNQWMSLGLLSASRLFSLRVSLATFMFGRRSVVWFLFFWALFCSGSLFDLAQYYFVFPSPCVNVYNFSRYSLRATFRLQLHPSFPHSWRFVPLSSFVWMSRVKSMRLTEFGSNLFLIFVVVDFCKSLFLDTPTFKILQNESFLFHIQWTNVSTNCPPKTGTSFWIWFLYFKCCLVITLNITY